MFFYKSLKKSENVSVQDYTFYQYPCAYPIDPEQTLTYLCVAYKPLDFQGV